MDNTSTATAPNNQLVDFIAHPKTGIYYDARRRQFVALVFAVIDGREVAQDIGRCSEVLRMSNERAFREWERNVWNQFLMQ